MSQLEFEPLPDLRPRPEHDSITRFFWDAAAEGRLVMQRCGSCKQLQYPPEVCCVRCQTTELEHVQVSGRGTLFSYAIVDRLLRSSVTLADVDVAQLYDGFIPVTVSWIEALGSCGRGEFGDWVGDGSRIGPGGDFPINTAGGQLAEGRLHGISFLNEAVLQLRGQGEDRQVPGAEVAVVTSGLYMQCGAMVLTAS